MKLSLIELDKIVSLFIRNKKKPDV